MTEAPRIVVTGMARAGLGLLSDMLRDGGASFVVCIDPHTTDYGPIDRKTIGLWIERSPLAIQMSHLKTQNVGASSAKANRHLRDSLGREFFAARNAAARLFAPVFTFSFDQCLSDPASQAMRMARLFWPGNNLTDLGPPACPDFDPRKAAMACRRILHIPPDRRTLRIVDSIAKIPEHA